VVSVVDRLLGVMLSVVVVVVGAADAQACGCTELPDFQAHPEAAQAEVRSISLLADAEVVELRSREVCWPDAPDDTPCIIAESAVFAIKTPYKGAPDSVIEVGIDRDDVYDPVNDCDLKVIPGKRMLLAAYFLTENTKYDVAGYHTNACTANIFAQKPIRAAVDDYRRQWEELKSRAEAAPADPAPWRSLATFFERWRDYPAALNAYRRATEIAPDDSPSMTSLGRMLFYLRHPEAGVALGRAVALNPSDSRAAALQELVRARYEVRYKYGAKFEVPMDLRDLDLRRYRFVGIDLSGADFRGADLRGAWFERVDLTGANFEGLDLQRTLLKDAKLARADLRNTRIYGMGALDLKDAKLEGASLGAGTLGYAPLLDADLTGAHITCLGTPDRGVFYDAGVPMEYLENYKLAQRIKSAQPAAELGPACLAGIANYLEPSPETAKCASWAAEEEDRPGDCHIADDD
jgi:tetratricopeptide (TPR) repeat protein